jgi:tetratricopeptide (TPR) repeat protein
MQLKIVHKNKMNPVADDDNGNDWKSSARLLEREGNNEKAIHLYESTLKKHSHDAYIYDRLMILYRKEKAYKKELSLIITAIGKFTDLLQRGKNVHSKKVASLSKSILHSVGLTDKKGLALYQPQPIARWEKRKKTVKQKLTTSK